MRLWSKRLVSNVGPSAGVIFYFISWAYYHFAYREKTPNLSPLCPSETVTPDFNKKNYPMMVFDLQLRHLGRIIPLDPFLFNTLPIFMPPPPPPTPTLGWWLWPSAGGGGVGGGGQKRAQLTRCKCLQLTNLVGKMLFRELYWPAFETSSPPFYTVRKVVADSAVFDWWRYCRALWCKV